MKRILFYVLSLHLLGLYVDLISKSSALSKSIIDKYGFANIICKKNVCTSNILCQIYSSQNMCLLNNEIPPELKQLSYAIYPLQVNCYNTSRFSYNKLFNIFPHAIIYPRTYQEVVYVLSIVRKYNLEFSLRSGGHCAEPGSLSNGYVIDLSKFNIIKPNVERSEVFIGSGTVLGEVIQRLGALNFVLPTGSCSGVGITGLSLGGGLGLLSRKYGLTTDSIKSITMVLANGQVVEVSADNIYSDLFWAMRGAGGGSFGVVLGITFNMHYLPKASLVKLTFNWDTTDIIALANSWNNWVSTLSYDITSEMDFRYNNGSLEVTIDSLKASSDPFVEWQSAFSSYNPAINITTGRYVDCAQQFASVYTQPFSKARSKFIFSPLSNAGVQTMIDNLNNLKALNAPYLAFVEMGSARGKISQGNSAYFPRNAFAYMFMFIYWNYQTDSRGAFNAINSIYNDLVPYTSPYSYSNLVDYELGNTYLDAYYGTNIGQLISIKNKYDPNNIFK